MHLEKFSAQSKMLFHPSIDRFLSGINYSPNVNDFNYSENESNL